MDTSPRTLGAAFHAACWADLACCCTCACALRDRRYLAAGGGA